MYATTVSISAVPKRVGIGDLLAFAAIYVLWGGTFLAIRIAVLEIPPFFTAGARFLVAGVLLYGFMRLRGNARPSLLEWRNLALIGLLMFVLTYGPLFWAMQYVPSSMSAVIEATLPITTIALEVFLFRTQRLHWRIASGVGIGFLGVLVLLLHNGGQDLAPLPCLVILGCGIAWSLGAVLSKRLSLPPSRALSAGAQMMLGGLVLLGLAFATGEMQPFPRISTRVALALLYLVIFGSLIAYTAYVWLLGRFSATQVSSHAYVNPLIAVALGHFAAGETVTLRSIVASFIIVGSVFLLLKTSTTLGTPILCREMRPLPPKPAYAQKCQQHGGRES
jgi:drug/metabolite transporter (DMT)-like permease